MNILDHFNFENVGSRNEDLETPVPLVDIGVVEHNLKKWQARSDKLGIANWPHIKTHKLVALAKAQIDLGARGITVQKLGEAEVMADAGITDMLLTFNVVGAHKLERLAALAKRINISVVADSKEVVEGLSKAKQMAGRDIPVLVECDTGAGRNGVQSPEAAVDLAKLIKSSKGLKYGGLMTYPGTRADASVRMFSGALWVARRVSAPLAFRSREADRRVAYMCRFSGIGQYVGQFLPRLQAIHRQFPACIQSSFRRVSTVKAGR
jgi:D-serine deaminase-like pyridoxal phosphate-dependent protein